ncbi:GNAT family N-acetyltransferase [Clostridium sp. D2Q-14]|uniref:GNAT family N-acetyltransferase n=1 Tax=Anaeromonas gelatinilytica TaxID=2683194 RepID=UPI00193B5361|nr:GNAT family N-acetyltransferase [Anaeromonas gelatinilytica]MBS4534620.1 GNAT family N-acetyltransferase [Anaeromonas gelatinilytica]
MFIRMGSIEELEKLCQEESLSKNHYTIDKIKKENQEIWVIMNDKKQELIGQLYIIWNLEDKDKANGKNRAYLCSFKILEKYRRHGFGNLLMERVLQRIKDKGFTEATIEVDKNLDIFIHIYKKMGFDVYLKTYKEFQKPSILLLNSLEY